MAHIWALFWLEAALAEVLTWLEVVVFAVTVLLERVFGMVEETLPSVCLNRLSWLDAAQSKCT